MAAILTISDIKAMCPEAASVADSTLQMYIDVVAQADTCLDTGSVPDSVQLFLKANAVCHYVARSQGGTVKSESDMDGASVTFDSYKVDGYGLASTTFGQNILSSGNKACFNFMDAAPNRFITAIGR